MEYLLGWNIVTAVFLHTSESCEPDWILYERLSVCYKLFTSPQFIWPDAKNFCIREEANLTDIYDRGEQMFIKNTLLKKASGHGVWVGASDSEVNNDWRWVDNTKMDIHRFDWWDGNPNNRGVSDFWDLLIIGEDCLEISLKAEYRGQPNDYLCNETMPFICKKKYIPTTTPPTKTMQPSSEADDIWETYMTTTDITKIKGIKSNFMCHHGVSRVTLLLSIFASVCALLSHYTSHV